MKPRIIKLSALLLLLFAGIGCHENVDDLLEEIVIENFEYVGCKEDQQKSTKSELLSYKTIDGNFLQIEHEDAWFNCCPGELITSCQLNNDTIVFTEDEKEAACDCICRYDLNCKIGPLEYGDYLFVLKRGTSVRTESRFFFSSNTNQNIDLNNH